MQAIIFANGDLNPGPMVDRVLDGASEALLVAADGGARHVLAAGLYPHVIIGDMDSLSEDELIRCTVQGSELQRHPPAKDETDLELALRYVVARGADQIRVIGAMGNRLDQTQANILLLTLPQLAGLDVKLVSGAQAAWVVGAGSHTLAGAVGDTLSLIPLGGDVTGITTQGLAFPLVDDTLKFGPARGISNSFSEQTADIRIRAGRLLLVHTLGRA